MSESADVGMSPDYGRRDLPDQVWIDEMCQACGREQPCPHDPLECWRDRDNDQEDDDR